MTDVLNERPTLTREQIESRVRELGYWFHNLDLQGVRTAPDHFLGDFPAFKWKMFADAVPADLTGKSVLDIGCNSGFYSQEMKKRGADRVLGIDFDADAVAQARFAAEVNGLDIEFRQLSVYDVGALGEQFDVVLFLGVFYHLRHPLLALDLIAAHVAKDWLVFQSLQRGSREIEALESDYSFFKTDIFERPGYPVMYFVENKYAEDETNWWIPNRAGAGAMLRSAGFNIVGQPETDEEVWICRKRDLPDGPDGPRPVYPARHPQAGKEMTA